MKTDFHSVVIERDGGCCVYHTLFYGDSEVAAKWGDHIVPQEKSKPLKLAPWNGIATCDSCNLARKLGILCACVVVTHYGHIQLAWDGDGHVFMRTLMGDHVGEWRGVGPEYIEYRTNHAYDDKGQVLA